MKTTKTITVIAALAGLWVLLPQPATAFYNPSTGRWLSRDRLGESGGVGLYISANNDLICRIDALGLWTHDIWTGGWGAYDGNAYADCGDTLDGLAELVTGNRADASLLKAPQPIAPGQKVDITPLLTVLEGRLRANVANATTLDFGPSFGQINVPTFFNSGSSGVDAFFDDTGVAATVDCGLGALIMLAKGLLDTIGAADFNGLHYQYNKFPTKRLPDPSVGKLKIGDVAFLSNYLDYLQKTHEAQPLWAGENVIKVGDNRYWGFGGGSVMTLDQWYDLLRQNYNEETSQSRTDPLPGFQSAGFIDVARMAVKRFELRRGR